MRILICILFILLCLAESSKATVEDSITLSVSTPYVHNKDLLQQMYYTIDSQTCADIRLTCFLFNNNDSSILYDLEFHNVKMQRGTERVILNLEKNSKLYSVNYVFWDIVKKFDIIPPGEYTIYISMRCAGRYICKSVSWMIDSALNVDSRLAIELGKPVINGRSIPLLKKGYDIKNTLPGTKREITIRRIAKRAQRKFGLTTSEIKTSHVSVDFYYKDWFVGRKSLPPEGNKDNNNYTIPQSFNDIFKPISGISISDATRRRERAKENKEGINGLIDLNTSLGTSQEPGSEYDNNFVELTAGMNTEVLGLPVTIEGFYTTQDNNRRAKASYLRFHYDIDRAKNKLNRSIAEYKDNVSRSDEKYTASMAVYQSLLNKLQGQRTNALHELSKEYKIKDHILEQYQGDVDEIVSSVDTNDIRSNDIRRKANARELDVAKDKLNKNKRDVKQKYDDIKVIDKKIHKYKALLEQYQKQRLLDSSMILCNIQDDCADLSYKKMARTAEAILPDGKAKSFIAGLTRFDLGILNAYESSYTMAGQTMKGGTVGYDLGLANIGVSLGKTEYISREGNLDRYNSYLGRIDFRPLFKQKLSLLYYGYSPTKQILRDNNFTQADISIPSFKRPVHIISVVHEGELAHNLTARSEAATSLKKDAVNNNVNRDNVAYKVYVQYNITAISMALRGEHEYMGNHFENNVLPYNNSSTERYMLAAEAGLLQSKIITGVQWNYIQQHSFYANGHNTKWGFDVRTALKRYPNISISYKPYSTFRRFDDTLIIVQKPLTGSVLVSRASYALKRADISHRLNIIYSQNKTTQDTVFYESSSLNLNYFLLHKKFSFSLTAGFQEFKDVNAVQSLFGSISFTTMLTKQLSVNTVLDIAKAQFGLQRTSVSGGVNYSLKQLPVSVRAQARYGYIKQLQLSDPIDLAAINVGISWAIKSEKDHPLK